MCSSLFVADSVLCLHCVSLCVVPMMLELHVMVDRWGYELIFCMSCYKGLHDLLCLGCLSVACHVLLFMWCMACACRVACFVYGMPLNECVLLLLLFGFAAFPLAGPGGQGPRRSAQSLGRLETGEGARAKAR